MSIFNNLPSVNIHFSQLINTPVLNEKQIKIGNLSDLFVDYEEIYPLVFAIQIKFWK